MIIDLNILPRLEGMIIAFNIVGNAVEKPVGVRCLLPNDRKCGVAHFVYFAPRKPKTMVLTAHPLGHHFRQAPKIIHASNWSLSLSLSN